MKLILVLCCKDYVAFVLQFFVGFMCWIENWKRTMFLGLQVLGVLRNDLELNYWLRASVCIYFPRCEACRVLKFISLFCIMLCN